MFPAVPTQTHSGDISTMSKPEKRRLSFESVADVLAYVDNLKRQPVADVVLTPDEAARYLKRSKSWLAKTRMRGTGPKFLRYGQPPQGRIAYLHADLDAFLAGLRRSSTSDPGPEEQAGR